MSAQVAITQLPAAGAITGSELVPIVQNGVTVRTTTQAIAGSPVQTQTFLTLNQEPTLPNSRRLSGGTGVGLVDGGAQSTLQITLNGASGSLEAAGTGLIAKTGAGAVTARQIAVSGTGLAVSNADGVSGNPTLSLSGLISAIAQVGGTGLLAIQNGTTAGNVLIAGTSDQISVANGNGSGGNPTISIANNPILPGSGSVTVPSGTSGQEPVGSAGMVRYDTTLARFRAFQGSAWVTLGVGDGTVTTVFGTGNQITVTNPTTTPTIALATNPILPGSGSVTLPIGTTVERPSGSNGMLRYNTDLGLFEGYINGSWQVLAAGSGVTSVGTGTGLLGGPITSTGTISIDNTVVATLSDTQTLTNKTINGPDNTLTNIANASLVNSSVTFNGVTVALGASGTITASTTAALTVGTGLQLNSGTTFDGSAARTISIDSTVATLTGTQTLTNKSMSGASNTFTNIPNSALTNSSITLGTSTISLGGTELAPAGLTSVTVTQDPTSALQLATKQYVDGLASTGLIYHAPVQVATTQSLAAQTGGTVTYNNGTAGVGATLTLSVALTTLDGYSLVNGDRILVKNETNQAYNGVYTWATGGTVLTRSTDTDSYGTGSGDLSENDYFFVQNGTTNKGNSYVCTTAGTIVFGTTAITFAQFSTSQVYTAGTGLTLTGTQFSLTTPVTAALGGTGLASYATGDMLYASGSTTLSKLTIGTSNYVMTSNGTAPQWVNSLSSITLGNTNTVTLKDTNFTLQDDADTTKQAVFQLSGLTTATTVTFTLPPGSAGASTLVDLQSSQSITGTKTFSGTTQNIGSSTATSTINVGYGATVSASTKTVNIGTAGVSGSTTNVNIGSSVSGSLGTIALQAPTVNLGQTATQLQVTNTASAVNYIRATGAITTASPVLSSQGTDANIDFTITPKGTGKVVLTNGLQGGAF
jgi:hypothetical protein